MFKDREILTNLEYIYVTLNEISRKLDVLAIISKKNLVIKKEKKDV